MRYFLILLLAAVAYGTDLPPDAAQAVAAYDKTCADAQAKADAIKADAAKRLLPLLDAAQKKATQKGDLDAAMAVKAKAEEVFPAPRLFVTAPYIGSWILSKGARVEIMKGRAATWDARLNGSWTQKGETVTIQWTNGITSLVFLENGKLVMQEQKNGKNTTKSDMTAAE
jgi:hypothetical protein